MSLDKCRCPAARMFDEPSCILSQARGIAGVLASADMDELTDRTVNNAAWAIRDLLGLHQELEAAEWAARDEKHAAEREATLEKRRAVETYFDIATDDEIRA